jgi:polyhydroxyalkanoate synthesis repressor PhaR
LAKAAAPDDTPVRIKKYANRRLYNTATSSYVTLDHLAEMVKEGIEFVVTDAKTGEDITRSVLTQIIFEQESKGQHLLPLSFLRQLIGFYGDSLQSMLPGYLEMSMEAFARNQEEMRRYMTESFGGMFPFRQIEDMGRQNMAMFEQAMTMFQPPAGAAKKPGAEATAEPKPKPKSKPVAGKSESEAELAELRRQLEEMRHHLDRLAGEE